MTHIPEFESAGGPQAADAMRRALDEHGIFVVRNVLTTAEIDRLRTILRGHLTHGGRRLGLGKTQPNAAEKVRGLSFIFAHPAILQVMTQVLGESNVAFTGHCDIHMNMLSGWHKDSGENVPGGYFTGPYMTAPECRVYKVAIYLQDTGPRDGFTARLGSHRISDLTSGEVETARSRIGDIVVFDVRITHTGQLPDLVEKGLKGISRILNKGKRDNQDPAWVTRTKSRYWKLIRRRDRLSVFFTYGAHNTFTNDFAEANMNRQARQGAGGAKGFPAELRKALEGEGVTLCDTFHER